MAKIETTSKMSRKPRGKINLGKLSSLDTAHKPLAQPGKGYPRVENDP